MSDLVKKCTTYSIPGDGRCGLAVRETAERDRVVVEIADHNGCASIYLTFGQWDALCDLRYEVSVERPKPKPVDVPLKSSPIYTGRLRKNGSPLGAVEEAPTSVAPEPITEAPAVKSADEPPF